MKLLGQPVTKPPFVAQFKFRDPDPGLCTVLSMDWDNQKLTMKSQPGITYMSVDFDDVILRLAGPICNPVRFHIGTPRDAGFGNSRVDLIGSDERFDRLAAAVHCDTRLQEDGAVVKTKLVDVVIAAYHAGWDAEVRQSHADKPRFIDPSGNIVDKRFMVKAVRGSNMPPGYLPIPDAPGYCVNAEGSVLVGGKPARIRSKAGLPYVKVNLRTHDTHMNVGRLVLKLFGPPDLGDRFVVKWLNGDKFDNNLSNLSYVRTGA